VLSALFGLVRGIRQDAFFASVKPPFTDRVHAAVRFEESARRWQTRAMCGIGVVLESETAPPLPPWPFRQTWSEEGAKDAPATILPSVAALLPTLARRGPDASSTVTIPLLPGSPAPSRLSFLAATLSLRHPTPLPHPYLLDPAAGLDSPLLIYNGELYDVPASPRNEGGASDTLHLTGLLTPLLTATVVNDACEAATLSALDALRGPFAIVGWAPRIRRLYFIRDAFGRRSLLLASVPRLGTVIASAIPRGYCAGFAEVPPIGLCYLDLTTLPLACFGFIPRPSRLVLPREPRPPVASNNPSSIATPARRRAQPELNRSYLPEAMSRACNRVSSPLLPLPEDATRTFVVALERSVQRRLALSAPPATSKGRPLYALLFSGGLDSLLLAVVLDRVLPAKEPFDLINVAFGDGAAAISACPDRVSGIKGYHELMRLRTPGRSVRLLCIDVAPQAADEALEKHVRHLVHPCEQLMDASIGTALWMAARGCGRVYSAQVDIEKGDCREEESVEVTTPARVVFSGLGADELAGGYKGRHRMSFRLGGARAVENEIDADLGRLWCRNLGRDDRLISDSGREVRHPFLDEDLVRFVTRLPLVERVCDLSLPDGVGDKQLLRRAALSLGLSEEAAQRPKRAIQFGSRSKHVLERRVVVPI
jgi:asparagine synthetase B (glutamine-hydrolysing)